jgi:RES domain-containing protein
MNETRACWYRVRECEEAVKASRQRAEDHHREERKHHWEEDTMAQQREQEWCAFQRAHIVTIPETPRPTKIRLQISTPVSTLSAGSP